MRSISYLLIGILFGITMYKSEAASWFRIYEMFQFGVFHMYGIIGSALTIGIVLAQIIKHKRVKSLYGEVITFQPKAKGYARYILGGIIFGLGWGLAGACPGPMFTLVGAGYSPILIVILFAIFGTYLYGVLKNKLPH